MLIYLPSFGSKSDVEQLTVARGHETDISGAGGHARSGVFASGSHVLAHRTQCFD